METTGHCSTEGVCTCSLQCRHTLNDVMMMYYKYDVMMMYSKERYMQNHPQKDI